VSDARVREIFEETAALHRAAVEHCAGGILKATDAIVDALIAGNKVMVFGNGGSAADAQHFAAELVGRFQIARAALAALALTTDTSILTSIANDFAYDQVFVRQIQALGRQGDVAIGISTSGKSPNVLAAFEEAKRRKILTIALVGAEGSYVRPTADFVITTPTPSTARIQELHRTIIHSICELVEVRTQHNG
jgi:D-sedoheptulose 7-phosphate isomerase